MKTLLLFLIWISAPLIGFTLNQIENSNFEKWTISSNGRDSLIGWSSSNSVVIDPVISLYKDMGSFEGNYAANLVTAPFGFVQYSTIGVLVNGSATFSYNGGGGASNIEHAGGGGTPISFKPNSLNGYYKNESLSAGDHAYATVLLSKYNTETGLRDTVRFADFNFLHTAEFTAFDILLSDLMPEINPDTITTVFYSSHPETVEPNNVWSNLYLDGLWLEPSVSTDIENIKNEKVNLTLFPNPNQGIFTVNNLPANVSSLEIYDSRGRKLKSINMKPHTGSTNMDLSDFTPGIYFLGTNNLSTEAVKIILSK